MVIASACSFAGDDNFGYWLDSCQSPADVGVGPQTQETDPFWGAQRGALIVLMLMPMP